MTGQEEETDQLMLSKLEAERTFSTFNWKINFIIKIWYLLIEKCGLPHSKKGKLRIGNEMHETIYESKIENVSLLANSSFH